MSWQDYYRRNEIIDGALAEVGHGGRAVIPPRWQRTIVAVFGSEDAFLAAVHYRWLNTLTARLDAVIEDSTGDRAAAAERIRAGLASERPGLWALLAAHADRRGLVTAREVEQQRCGWAGLHPA